MMNCAKVFTAEKLIKAELSKKSAGEQASNDIIRDLNFGGKKSPYKSSIPAFMTSMDTGVVRINGQNLDAAIGGSMIIIECDWTGDGLANATFPVIVE